MTYSLSDSNTKEIFSLIPKRMPDSNKGSYGRALFICGSYGMAGAAVIAARASIHSGVGIAHIICTHSIYPIISQSVPEAVFTPIGEELNNNDRKSVISAIKKANAVVIGCGMGMSDYTRGLLNIVLTNSKVPVIIDADGINCLCDNIELLSQARCDVILTPHPGEMARLCGESVAKIQQNRLRTAEQFVAKHDLTLVLKGHETIVMAKDKAMINHSGNAGMACAGSGDMLCGIMASLLTLGLSAYDSARAAVHIHGICGDLSADKYSMAYITPTDMIKCLSPIFKQIEQMNKGD